MVTLVTLIVNIDESELAKLEGPLLLKGHGVLVTWGPAWTTTVTAGQHPAEVHPGEGQFAAPAARCLNGRKGGTLRAPSLEVTLPLRLEAKRQQAQSEGNPEDGGRGQAPWRARGSAEAVWASADSDEPGRVPFGARAVLIDVRSCLRSSLAADSAQCDSGAD